MQGTSRILPRRLQLLKRQVRTTAIVIQRVASMYHQRKVIVYALYGFLVCHFLVSAISTGIVSWMVTCGMYGPCPGSLRSFTLLITTRLLSSATVLRVYHQGMRAYDKAAQVHWFAVDRVHNIRRRHPRPVAQQGDSVLPSYEP